MRYMTQFLAVDIAAASSCNNLSIHPPIYLSETQCSLQSPELADVSYNFIGISDREIMGSLNNPPIDLFITQSLTRIFFELFMKNNGVLGSCNDQNLVVA